MLVYFFCSDICPVNIKCGLTLGTFDQEMSDVRLLFSSLSSQNKRRGALADPLVVIIICTYLAIVQLQSNSVMILRHPTSLVNLIIYVHQQQTFLNYCFIMDTCAEG